MSSNKESLCPAWEEQEQNCKNDGRCLVIETTSGTRTRVCRCDAEWRGNQCELQSIDSHIALTHEKAKEKAQIVAGASTCLVILLIALLMSYVYIRYRRRSQRLLDRPFKATAEELYRRPFSGRTSVVESLSRANSIRKALTNDKEAAQTTKSHELSVPLENTTRNDGNSSATFQNNDILEIELNPPV